MSLASMPPSLELHRRANLRSAWEKRLPHYLQIRDTEYVQSAAKFLSDLSYALETGTGNDGTDGRFASELAAEVVKAQNQGDFSPENLEDAREWGLRAIALRRGQMDFRSNLIVAYAGRCAITGCDALPALEAAHIVPYCGPQSNHVSNGLLLRADVHTLFDLDLIGIDPDCLEVAVVPSLQDTCYASIAGNRISTPASVDVSPSREALAQRWSRFSSPR